ncbi:putative sterigmatocystin biosynthesis P450 monooxygenase STCB [Talaromyces islandicus]|uniref:Putative sterigmatocystin biosynthesis P450 monooxygenase STCB n=1 Tax=Talaromyces islandicus TaxID=28573 RepID=A0A0U1M8A9_TALIS|nr:putative sterigmatocystin biosynthesis P450 monooxygenase STCB [Talaromyces islandicus]
MLDIPLTYFFGLPFSLLLAGGLAGCLLISDSLSAIPGPWLSKWTGALTTYYWFIGQRAQYVDSLHRRYGPIVRVSPTEVAINDITAIKQIHKVGGPFMKSNWYYDLTTAAVNNVFNTTNPGYHSRLRKLLSSPISEANLKEYEGAVTDRVLLAVRRVGEEINSRGTADIFKWMTFLATDVIGELSFGQSFQMLERGEKNQYVRDLEALVSQQPFQTTFPFLIPVARYLNLGVFRQVVERVLRMKAYATESVQRYQDHLAQHPTNPKPTLFTKVFGAEKDHSLTYEELLFNAQAYIVAGSDTTAVTLTYLIYCVCKHPKVLKKLVEEVQSLPDNFTDKECRELPFIDQVMTETMRLYPVVPTGLPRVVPAGGSVLVGHQLPGGITVSTQAYSMHHNPDVFDSPECFDPSRWENPSKEMREWFMPFGGGSRSRKNRGETLESAAVRETYEETGYPCQLLLHNSLPTKAPLGSWSPNDPQEENSSRVQNKSSESELHTEPFAIQQWVYQDGTRKLIFWFLAIGNSMQLPHENTQDEGENFEAFWFDRDSSLAIATYDDDRALIEKAFNVLNI